MSHNDRLTIEQAAAHINGLVRVAPQAFDKNSRHWGRAKIVGTTRRKVLIRPLGGHGLDEEVSPSHLKLWHAKLPEDQQKENHPVNANVNTNNRQPAPPQNGNTLVAALSAAPAVDRPDEPAQNAGKPTLSDCLSRLTVLIKLASEAEKEQGAAERDVEIADQTKKAAEARAMEAMGKLETVKAKIRKEREALDVLVEP